MVSEAKKRANAKFDKENYKNVMIKLNKKTDADIIKYLESCDNKNGEIKRILRAEIEKSKL